MNGQYDVIIIGAGPAGLAAARALQDAGVKRLLIVERENEAGGVPRHCRHPTFGVQTCYRPMSGHRWARKNVARLGSGCEIRTATNVLRLLPEGRLEVTSDRGLEMLQAQRVIIATGVRETPRHPRLVSGLRPQGILTAGALQQFIYLKKLLPGTRPVIVGSELVSFSALWTLRNAGIRALAMIDDNPRPVAWRFCTLFARLLGVPVYLNAHLSRINGLERVESIEFSDPAGKVTQLACDSVIFTGRFTGEYTLIRGSHLACEPDSGRPVFDQHGCCSDPAYYAVGNMTHPADMGDQCYQEGLRVGAAAARSLSLPPAAVPRVTVALDEVFRIAAPNVLRPNAGIVTLNVRVNAPWRGQIVVRSGDRELYRRTHRCMPERRVLLRGIDSALISPDEPLIVAAG
ncbi:FAD-dependent oxidoreductase [Entomohabitans teleogrylli]|uniref:FAD-dependent oxidoreductase n=1 Tax=Entomohabitans teleogrylli TaxID=1384589 RepID=UPI00073D920A|nr:FAD-dependent oxidoreductase [Entomohabitans teleogrylli]